MAENKFAQKVTKISDLNNPPKVAYSHQAFPKMVYHADGRIGTVKDAGEDKVAAKKGFRDKPFADFDYSKIQGGKAPKKDVPPAADSFEETFDDLDEAENQAEAESLAENAAAETVTEIHEEAVEGAEEVSRSRRRNR